MVREIVITATAEKQIYEYLAFIAEQWPEKIVKEAAWGLKERFDKIGYDPELFIAVPERPGTRRCFHPPHLHIYFRYNENSVTILSVFDVRQNPARLKI